MTLTFEMLLKTEKITIADHSLKRGFLKKCIVRVGISKVLAIRPNSDPKIIYLRSIVVKFMQFNRT